MRRKTKKLAPYGTDGLLLVTSKICFHTLSLKAAWQWTRTSIKNMSSKNVDISRSIIIHRYSTEYMHTNRGHTLKSAIFTTSGPPWP